MSRNHYFKKVRACKAPWIGMSIRNGNRLSFCSNSSFSAPIAPGQPLSEALNSAELQLYRTSHFENTPLSSCSVCVHRGDLNVRTQRDAYNDLPATVDLDQALQLVDPENVIILDMNLSNVCNLKCRMCSSLRSTTWKEDQKKLSDQLDFIGAPASATEPDIEMDLEKFPRLKYFILKGGEPLFDRRSIQQMERLVQLGRSREITLTIFTNGVFVKQNIELLKQFKKLNLIFSFEGTGDLYSYIRGGKISFSDFESNIHAAASFDNIAVTFMYTPQAYNVFDFAKALEFIAFKINPVLKNKLDASDFQNTFGNILFDPAFLKISVLPEAVRREALSQLKSSPAYTLIDWSGLEKFLLLPQETELYRKFIDYTRKLDQIRNENIFDFIPEFSQFGMAGDFAARD
jgi:hypothetical protein